MSYDRRSGDKRKWREKAFTAKVKKSDEGKAWRKSTVARTGADNEKLEEKPVDCTEPQPTNDDLDAEVGGY